MAWKTKEESMIGRTNPNEQTALVHLGRTSILCSKLLCGFEIMPLELIYTSDDFRSKKFKFEKLKTLTRSQYLLQTLLDSNSQGTNNCHTSFGNN